MNKKNTLIYDELCPLCKRFKQALDLLDINNKLEFLDANDDETYKKFPNLNKEDCLTISHFITINDEIITGADIITILANEYPGISKFAWLLETNVGKKVNSYFYNSLEKLRSKTLSNCPRCNKKHVN